MVVLRGANEVLITIMRSMLYVSPHNIIKWQSNFEHVQQLKLNKLPVCPLSPVEIVFQEQS